MDTVIMCTPLVANHCELHSGVQQQEEIYAWLRRHIWPSKLQIQAPSLQVHIPGILYLSLPQQHFDTVITLFVVLADSILQCLWGPNLRYTELGTELNRELSTWESKMAERYVRKCSTSFAIWKMQIKASLRYHLIPVRMAKIKNTNDCLCWRGCEVRGTLLHCWWEWKLVQPLWKSVWQFLRKLWINLPQDPAIQLLGIYRKDAQLYYKGNYLTPFIAALSVIARTWKKPRCPSIKDWIQKMSHIYTLEYYSDVKKNDNLNFACKWLELGNTILSEVTQKD